MAHDNYRGLEAGLTEIDFAELFDSGYFEETDSNDQATEQESFDETTRYERFQYDQYDWEGFCPPDYRVVPLTKGYFAVVSPEDYEEVAKFKWCANEQIDKKTGHISKVYAYRRRTKREEKRGAPNLVYLHRFIKKVLYAGHLCVVDHRSGDSLDCRNDNLKVTDQTGNHGNRSFTAQASSTGLPRGVKPVMSRKKGGGYRTTGFKGRIKVRRKEFYSKTVFRCEHRAHRWYVRMHKALYPIACSWRDLETVPKLILPRTIEQALAEDIPF